MKKSILLFLIIAVLISVPFAAAEECKKFERKWYTHTIKFNSATSYDLVSTSSKLSFDGYYVIPNAAEKKDDGRDFEARATQILDRKGASTTDPNGAVAWADAAQRELDRLRAE
jgi:hypothetical protein